MFSLIIAVIAVILVALLALATVYYGSNALQDGTSSATKTKILNEGGTIQAALQMYETNNQGALPTGTSSQAEQTLVNSGYLSAWPDANYTLATGYVQTTVSDQTACQQLDQQLIGTSTIPSCTNTAYTGVPVCCQ